MLDAAVVGSDIGCMRVICEYLSFIDIDVTND